MHTIPNTSAPHRPVPSVKAIFGWIVETDRKFRMAQARIDGLTDRF